MGGELLFSFYFVIVALDVLLVGVEHEEGLELHLEVAERAALVLLLARLTIADRVGVLPSP